MLDSVERGSYYRWLLLVARAFDMASTVKANNWEIAYESAVSIGCDHTQDALIAIEHTLAKHPYLCGYQFTKAYLFMTRFIGLHTMLNILEPNPVFAEYVERCKSREPAKRADALDNALGEKIL